MCRATELLPVIESALIDRFGKPELNLKWGNRIVPIGQRKTRCTDIDENIQRRLVALRRTDWALVEEVAKKLQLHLGRCTHVDRSSRCFLLLLGDTIEC